MSFRSIELGFKPALLMYCLLAFCNAYAQVYTTANSKVKFKSEAALETITAESTELKGLLDTKNKMFAFTINNESFKGFNSPLQRDHFNENYLESDKYPVSSFNGKIIDDIDFNTDGVYVVRTKGMMSIKGINREQLIRSTVEIKNGIIKINANFPVLLDDYSIRVPRIVNQKISPIIDVFISAVLEPKRKK